MTARFLVFIEIFENSTKNLARLIKRNKVRLNLFPRTMLPFEGKRREKERKEVRATRENSTKKLFHFSLRILYRWQPKS